MLKMFQNHFKFFWGCMVCFGVPMPPQLRDKPRAFWGVVMGSFMCGLWLKVQNEPSDSEKKHGLRIEEIDVPASAIVVRLKDFSVLPMGRFRIDSASSAEEFRERYLVPDFIAAETLGVMFVVDIRGILGPAYNWVEETYGGLLDTFTKDRLLQRFRVISSYEFECDDIKQVIDEADAKRLKNCDA